uniref:Uncharacterized protein n=1 Tax=Anguilla anguilla TaxID=7936 RepID=A0A0E9PXF2_ANGAN
MQSWGLQQYVERCVFVPLLCILFECVITTPSESHSW